MCGYVLLQTSVLHLFNIQLPRCRRYKGLTGCLHLDHRLPVFLLQSLEVAIFSRTFWPWQKSKIANSTCPGPTIDYCIQQRCPKQIGPTGFFGYTFTTPKASTMLQSSSNLLRQRLQNPVLRLIASFSSSNAIQNDPYKFRPQTDSKVFDNRGELKEFKPMDIQAKMDKIFNGAEAEKEKKAMNVHSDGPMGVGILGK